MTWGELDRATQEHGLATPGGRVSTTGVAGFTLGGGSGWLERKYGLACDNLVAVELVTAAGDRVRAAESETPTSSGRCTAAAATSAWRRPSSSGLHPVGPIVMAGLMLWPGERGPEVIEACARAWTARPTSSELACVYLTGPPEEFVPPELQGQLCCAAACSGPESPRRESRYARRFRELEPAVDLVGPMPYAEFQCMIDDPPGLRNYWTADYLDELSDEAVEVFVSHSERMPVPSACQSIMFPWGGQVARVSPGDTPMAQRDANWVVPPVRAVGERRRGRAAPGLGPRDLGAT